MIDIAMTAEDLVRPAIVQEEKRPWRWRSSAVGEDDLAWLGIIRDTTLGWPETAALPGEVVTPDAVEHSRQRKTLIDLVDRFAAEGFGWSGDRFHRPSGATSEAARAFLTSLSSGTKLPRIAPDSEGSIVAVWDHPTAAIVVVIDGWYLHMVTAPGTDNARYYDNMLFVAGALPDEIHEAFAALA